MLLLAYIRIYLLMMLVINVGRRCSLEVGIWLLGLLNNGSLLFFLFSFAFYFLFLRRLLIVLLRWHYMLLELLIKEEHIIIDECLLIWIGPMRVLPRHDTISPAIALLIIRRNLPCALLRAAAPVVALLFLFLFFGRP